MLLQGAFTKRWCNLLFSCLQSNESQEALYFVLNKMCTVLVDDRTKKIDYKQEVRIIHFPL